MAWLFDYRHFIEQPMLGCCCSGPFPVFALWRIALTNSGVRLAVLSIFASSRRPRYCSSPALFGPKQSGVQLAS